MTQEIVATIVRGSLGREALSYAADRHMIYFLAAPTAGMVKIGYSYSMWERVEVIQAMSPVRLNLIGAMPGDRTTEAALHLRFAHLRSHGEWFRLDDDLDGFISLQSMIHFWNSASRQSRARFIDLMHASGLGEILP